MERGADIAADFKKQTKSPQILIDAKQEVPATDSYGSYLILSQVFGYMVSKNTKYGILTTFNQFYFGNRIG